MNKTFYLIGALSPLLVVFFMTFANVYPNKISLTTLLLALSLMNIVLFLEEVKKE